jgi:hypothetical protein
MTLRGYLQKTDIAMRARAPRTATLFDAVAGTWVLGKHLIRSSQSEDDIIRFELITTGRTETLVGSYSGAIVAAPDSVAHYLLYFLETGKPWHSGLPIRGLA